MPGRNAMTIGSTNFSLAQARGIIRDLFTPDPATYWRDFLLTIVGAHGCFALVRRVPSLAPDWFPAWSTHTLIVQFLFFATSSLLFYRAVMFIHELVHLPSREFRFFRIVWNLLCGIPALVPSFTYYPHLDHHRRRLFGTKDDGEYLSLARMKPVWITLFLLQGLVAPFAGVLRFGIVTPLTWISPTFHQFVLRHFSSLVIDPTFIRPIPTRDQMFVIRLQEFACCTVCWGVGIGLVMFGKWPYLLLIQAYLVGVVCTTLNALRTVAAHRWSSDGSEQTFVDQMLDSVTIDSSVWYELLLNPVGLRFHALHHLFPSLPYHNASEAHRRLMAELPSDSPYRRTVEPSVLAAVCDLYRRAKEFQQSSATPTVIINPERRRVA